MAADRVTEYLDTMSSEDRQKCEGCTAQGRTYTEQIPFPTCKVAALQRQLSGKTPKLGEIGAANIDIKKIPVDCPNGY